MYIRGRKGGEGGLRVLIRVINQRVREGGADGSYPTPLTLTPRQKMPMLGNLESRDVY
jgi:hypothetical protein